MKTNAINWRSLRGHFSVGWQHYWTLRTDIISMSVIMISLAIVFGKIFDTMPLHQLGANTINNDAMFYYLMVAQLVLIPMFGQWRDFSTIIADDRLTSMMQRPGHILFPYMARLMGGYYARLIVLLCVDALLGLALMKHAPMPWQIFLAIISASLGIMIAYLIGYMISMVEIFGNYSLQCGWLVSKTIMAGGGTFFPVSQFPFLIKMFVLATPCPAILYAASSMVLEHNIINCITNMLWQMGWLVAMTWLALHAEKKLIRYVMEKGL